MTDESPVAGQSGTRASDADRDHAALMLREAMATGQIDVAELDQRLSAVYRARTRAELAQVSGDLDVTDRPPTVSGRAPASRFAAGIFGGVARRGRWVVPRTFTALTMFGGGRIDLSEADFTSQQTRIHAVSLFGGMRIVVPRDADVRVRGVALMGGFGKRAAGPAPSTTTGPPQIVISGLALFGAIGTRRQRGKRR